MKQLKILLIFLITVFFSRNARSFKLKHIKVNPPPVPSELPTDSSPPPKDLQTTVVSTEIKPSNVDQQNAPIFQRKLNTLHIVTLSPPGEENISVPQPTLDLGVPRKLNLTIPSLAALTLIPSGDENQTETKPTAPSKKLIKIAVNATTSAPEEENPKSESSPAPTKPSKNGKVAKATRTPAPESTSTESEETTAQPKEEATKASKKNKTSPSTPEADAEEDDESTTTPSKQTKREKKTPPPEPEPTEKETSTAAPDLVTKPSKPAKKEKSGQAPTSDPGQADADVTTEPPEPKTKSTSKNEPGSSTTAVPTNDDYEPETYECPKPTCCVCCFPPGCPNKPLKKCGKCEISCDSVVCPSWA